MSRETVRVADETALTRWLETRHPDMVETITRPRTQAVTALLATLGVSGGVAHTDDGEVIPGLTVTPGGQPGALSVRPASGVKGLVGDVASVALAQVIAEMTPPRVDTDAVSS